MVKMSKYDIDKISYRRINDIINAVNADMGPESIEPKLNENEMGYFEHLLEEKAKALKEHPKVPCIFSNVEYDYDDGGLDIYND